MTKLRLVNHQSPGDVLMLTAVVRDLHLTYPAEYVTDVVTPFPDLWYNNPFVTPLGQGDPEVREVKMEYPLVHSSNGSPYHFIHGFRLFLEEQLNRPIKCHKHSGDIHLSQEEIRWVSQVEEHFTGWDTMFLHCCGQMACCQEGGCWKSRTSPLGDADHNDENTCVNRVEFNGRLVQRCMLEYTTPEDVIRIIERYYNSGLVNYLPRGGRTIHAEWADRRNPVSRIPNGQRKLDVVLIASGETYCRAAAYAAATYSLCMRPAHIGVIVYVPRSEASKNTRFLKAAAPIVGFDVRDFEFKEVSNRKPTTQLKCQAFSAALEDAPADRLILFADADTCCRSPLTFDEEIGIKAMDGGLGMVEDVKDGHESRAGAPWFLPSTKRLKYVNSGIILTSREALPIFKRFLDHSLDERFLAGPFNDQNIINFVLGQFYPERLFFIDRRYNGMAPYRSSLTVISHHSGGAGNLAKSARRKAHLEECSGLIEKIDAGIFKRLRDIELTE